MYKSKLFFAFILLEMIFISGFLFAQKQTPQQKIDSLNTLISSTKNDSIKVMSILELGDIYRNTDLKNCSTTVAKGYQLAIDKKFQFGIARGKFLFGLYEFGKGNFKEAKKLYYESIDVFNKIKDTASAIKVNYNIGVVNIYTGDYVKANESFFNVLKSYEDLKNEKGMSDCYTAIANTFGRMGNSKLELEYHLKSLKIKEKLNDKYGIAACMINIGNVHGKKEEYDSALVYYFKGLKLSEEIQNQKWILNALGNIGAAYTQQGKTKEGLEYLLKCYQMAESIGDKHAIASTLNILGSSYITLKNYEKAKQYSEKALKIAIEIGSKLEIKQSYDNLATAYSELGDYKQAFNYHTLYANIKDSILNSETTNQLSELQAKYENDKQQKEIELLNKDNEIQAANINQQQIIIWFSISGFVLVLLLSFFIFKQYRLKQKSNLELQDAYNQIEEKNKEITDSIRYAKRIQQTLFPTEKYIERCLNPKK